MQIRAKALERRRMPDELDGMLTVAPARAWLALLALALALGGMAAYGFLTKLPREVAGSGMLTAGSLSNVQSTASGQVLDVKVQVGMTIKQGDPVVVLAGQGNHSRVIRAPFSGIVEDVDVAPGQVITTGVPLYTTQPALHSKTNLFALLFVTPKNGASIGPGMRVDLDVDSAPNGAYGVLRGQVASVSGYPASKATLSALLGDPTLADIYSANGAPIVVRVRLLTDPSTASGLKWSTPKGPPFPLAPGVSLTAEVIQSQQTPVKQLFGSGS